MRNIYRILIISVFIALLVGIIGFARGYRFDFQSQSIRPTGILALTSTPRAASVYVNGTLKGVTDINLTLPPGKYTVEIKKEGYTSWSKEITLKGEIVMSLDALLFPKNPSLSPLTTTGVVKALNIDQTGQVLLFVQGEDEEKDGIYIFESNQRTLSFFSPLTPVALLKNLPDEISLTDTIVYFSPDYSQMILEYSIDDISRALLISLNGSNAELTDPTATPDKLANVWQLLDATSSKETLLEAWRVTRTRNITKILETFPKEIEKIASSSFEVLSFSPDETKLLYRAIEPVNVPAVLKSPLIGSNQTPEERQLQKDKIYIYDKKEDKNLPFPEVKSGMELMVSPAARTVPRQGVSTLPAADDQLPISNYFIQWYPDSRHLAIMQEKEIVIMDYDGSNKRTIYSGPFEKTFFSVGSDGKLIILTNLNPQNNLHPDLYGVGIR